MELLSKVIRSSIATKQKLLEDEALLATISMVGEWCVASLKRSNRIWLCGNGGSAADAQHIATELSGRFYFDRPGLPVEALNINTAFLTAVGNDYGFEHIFARSLQAKAQAGDVLLALSTSGNSPNVVNAVKMAQQMDVVSIGFTGQDGGELKALCDQLIAIPSTDTPRIQECHLMIGHALCEYIEATLFPQEK